MAAALVVGGRGGWATFLVGLIVGVGIGLLIGPGFRSWLARREWVDASRQARLTDEIAARMERELDSSGSAEGSGETSSDRSPRSLHRVVAPGRRWPASR